MRFLLMWIVLCQVSGCASESQEATDSLAKNDKTEKVKPKPEEPPPRLTLEFHGQFATDGQITGFLTYDLAQGPMATNLYNLQPNVGYVLVDYELTITVGELSGATYPATVFRPSDPGNTVEFCEGTCVFSAPTVLKLVFANAGAYALTLVFNTIDPTPTINPPSTLEEWGSIRSTSSTYRIPCPICAPVALIQTGILTIPAP